MKEGGLGEKVFGALFGRGRSVTARPEEPVTTHELVGAH
jgi:hypothetical protein